MASTIQLTTADGQSFDAYFCEAGTTDAPGIVMIQEIFGINQSMRTLAQQWSARGYHVLVPDLFWRQERNVELEPRVEAEFSQGVALMQAVDQEVAVQDLDLARQWLASHAGHDRIGSMGYCFGGRMVVKMAEASPIRCAVSFYGVGLEEFVPNLPANTAPTLLHIAELDGYVPPAVRAKLLDEATQRPDWESHVYMGCDHAFARPEGANWVEEAATLANDRSQEFLQQHLSA